MGKRGGKGRENNNGFHTNMSIREEASGKKQSHNPKSLLKLKHLQNLAIWASGESKDDNFGSLGAFFGRSFADFGESLGIPPDSSLFPCQRCETILQPGSNCTVRIEKNRDRRHRRSKAKIPAQNNVVYTCHFCSHRNLKRGTPKGYVKEIAPPRVISSKKESVSSAVQECSTTERTSASNATMTKAIAASSPAVSNVVESLTASVASPFANLLDSKKRKRKKPGPKGSSDDILVNSASAQMVKAGGTSKKRKKGWTTLKDIAENEEREKNKRFTNFSIPFVL